MIIGQNENIKLRLFYQENGVGISGLTDIRIKILNESGNVIVNAFMVAGSEVGEYVYNWFTNGYAGIFTVLYLKNLDILDVEVIEVQAIGFQDGAAF